MNIKDKKIYSILIILLLLAGLVSIALGIKITFLNKSVVLDEVKLQYNQDFSKNMFAFFKENEITGEYDNIEENTWPSEYILNEEMSICIDSNGNEVENVLSFSNNHLNIRTNKKVFCYVYFKLPPKDISITVNTINDDGSISNRIPDTLAGYKKEFTCESEMSANWDYKYNRLLISNIFEVNNKCTLTYYKDTSDYTTNYLNQYIIDNAVEGTADGTNQDAGDIVHETFKDSSEILVDTGYRYEGKNPANYVWFNNELWRIIGVFDTEVVDEEGNISTAKEKLTKIIREEPIGLLAWNKTNNNNWPETSLYKLLNPIDDDDNSGAYMNSANGNDSGYCYGYSTTVKGNCDYTEKGLGGKDSYYGKMIKEVKWYLGAMSSTKSASNYYYSTAANWYTHERKTTTYALNDKYVIGYIGLMYGSDYGYSVKASSGCDRNTTLDNYASAYCASESWLYNSNEWLITHISNNMYYATHIGNSGYLERISISEVAYAVRPTLYLDQNVYIIKGTGTAIDPYIIGI